MTRSPHRTERGISIPFGIARVFRAQVELKGANTVFRALDGPAGAKYGPGINWQSVLLYPSNFAKLAEIFKENNSTVSWQGYRLTDRPSSRRPYFVKVGIIATLDGNPN